MMRGLSLSGLALRGVAHHRRAYLYVLLSAATATAIITGALLVGDSMRGSLADRVEERLGQVDHVLQGATFFREALAMQLEASPSIEAAVPVILVPGTVVNPESRRRSGSVNILGVPPGFWKLWSRPGTPPSDMESVLEGRRAVLNASCAAAVGVAAEEAVLVQFERIGEVPAEHAFGRRGEVAPPLRLEVGRVLPDSGLALFESRHGQRTPRNVFVPLGVLQRALEKTDLVNAVLLSTPSAGMTEDETAALAGEVAGAWTLEDSGLRLRVERELGYVALESRELLLDPSVEELLRRVFPSPGTGSEPAPDVAGIERLDVLTHLANTLAVGSREVPYSTVSAIGNWTRSKEGAADRPVFAGNPVGPGEILLGDWAAQDLKAEPGDTVRMDFFVVGDRHELVEKTRAFKVAGVVPLKGPAGDPGWTPDYPGISDAESVRDWDPPFPVDLDRIRDRDEDYWDNHRAAPKAFVSLVDGQALWSSRFGVLTSSRFRATGALPVEDVATRVAAALGEEVTPGTLGTILLPVRREGLRAARGASDFSGLFLALSFFLIVAALILLAMTFRLACERRARELGVLAAVGYPVRTIRQLLLLESSWVIATGSILGVVAGVAYAALLVEGLRTVWKDAVNAPFLSLHLSGTSLLGGCFSTGLLAVLTTFLVLRRVTKVPPRQLVAGVTLSPEEATVARRRRRVRRSLGIAYILAIAATALLLMGALPFGPEPEVAFFIGGTCLLVACLGLIDAGLHGPRRGFAGRRGVVALTMLGTSYSGRAPGRSLFTITLIACASFIIVTVSASRVPDAAAEPSRESGDGGFTLLARSSIPLTASLSTPEGCRALNIGSETGAALQRSQIHEFRVRSGDDVSCLNLYRPQSPQILGAPSSFLRRGGFAWSASLAETEEERANPWLLLTKTFPDGALPAVGDASAVTWILHSGLGKDVEVRDGRGETIQLRIVGLLSGSIFQGELLVSEGAFLESFPDVAGSRWFLLEAPAADRTALMEGLEEDLEDYGVDVEATTDILASYRAVTNTYLSTFQMLGGLGLLLGTLGLAAILLRNTNDRRAELALLGALGYSRHQVRWVILSETLFLLVAGLLAGGVSAVVCLVPSAERAAGTVSWADLALALGAVLTTGVCSALIALRVAMRAPVIASLRAE